MSTITQKQLNATFDEDEVDFRDFLKELESASISIQQNRKGSPTKKSSTSPSISPSESMMNSPSPTSDKSKNFKELLKQTINRKGFMRFLQRGN